MGWARCTSPSSSGRCGAASRYSANTTHSLGELLRRTGNLPEARRMIERALELQERTLEPENLDLAITLHTLASVEEGLGELGRAEELYQRALAIRQRILPAGHHHLVQTLDDYARLLDRLERHAEADGLRARARPAPGS